MPNDPREGTGSPRASSAIPPSGGDSGAPPPPIEAQLEARATRQAVLAELGLRALGKVDRQTLLNEAVVRIRATLDIATCTVLELAPDGRTFLCVAAVGWNEPVAGHLVVDAGGHSQAGYTMLSSEPVLVADYDHETRFPPVPVLRRHGIRSGMTVIIHGRERPYGVFGVQSTRLRKFTKEDVDYFQSAANVLGSAIERLRTEEDLRRSEVNLRNVLEGAPEGILISQDRRLCYVNRAMVQYLGYDSAGELLGKSAFEVVHPDDRQLVSGRLRGMDDTREPAEPREMRFLRRDGTAVLAESIGVPVVLDGKPAIAAMVRDITERKKMEARLQLGDRMTSLGTLAAGVAHEINNPLAYVLGNLELMRAQVEQVQALWTAHAPACGAEGAGAMQARLDDLASLIDGAQEGGERVRRIVGDLKTFSRADAAEQPGAVDVRKVLDSSINMARNEIRHRAQLELDYRPLPPVVATESRLGQVFLNLLVNATQAIPDGAANQHRIGVRTRTGDDGRAIVEITDTGCGIAPAIVDRLFDPFFTTKAVGVGTGLGLSICHSIVSGYGGELTVESEVGKGSCFRVSLPAAAPAEVVVAAPAAPAEPVRRGRVLIIDDEVFVARLCQRLLAPQHDVEVTTAAASAIALLESGEAYDVILCDVMMPEISGIDFYEQLERRWPHLTARVVFLSGGAFTAQAAAFRARVANRFLDKPCASAVLQAAVGERVRASVGERGDERPREARP